MKERGISRTTLSDADRSAMPKQFFVDKAIDGSTAWDYQ
jgi:hypothetical protein